ncbi:MAG: hypothetical protein LBJ69_00935 [Holosporales bacterium]|nr:hypothetical protein [Holosporales bacterium]
MCTLELPNDRFVSPSEAYESLIVYSVLAVFCVVKCMRHLFMQPVGDEHCFACLRSKAVVVLQMSQLAC